MQQPHRDGAIYRYMRPIHMVATVTLQLKVCMFILRLYREPVTGPSDICANSTQVYSVTPRAGSVYSWTIPGGAAIMGDPSGASISVVFANVGGIITCRETNIAGCITDHNPLTVTGKTIADCNNRWWRNNV